MADNRYRPGVPRRDSGRSPDYLNNRHSDRPFASRGDPDRASDYANDRYRNPSRGSLPEPRRSASGNQSHSDSPDTMSKMDTDKAVSDLAKKLRLLQEALADRVKWTNKKDVVLEGFRQRLATYERHGGRNAHEPSVAEAWRKHQEHYEHEEEKIEKELAKVDAVIKDTTDNFARLLVQSLPIGEIKERQLIDAAKSELARDRKSAPDDRAVAMEKQLASISELHNTLASDLKKLRMENEELLSRVSPTEKLEQQVASLAELQKAQQVTLYNLKKENDELRARNLLQDAQADSNKAFLKRETETLKQEKESITSQVSGLQTQLADLVKRMDSHSEDLTQSLQKATVIPLQEFKAVEGKVKTLEQLVTQHDHALSKILGEGYAEAFVKLPELEKILDGQASQLEHLNMEAKRLSNDMADVQLEASLAPVKDVSNSDFMQFSNKIIETCAKLVEDLKKNITDLQPRVASLEVQRDTTAMELAEFQKNYASNFNALSALQKEVRENHQGLQMMISGLDDQFKNMSTMEMAGIILENLKRLPTNVLPLDVQNFHDRLSSLESFRQEHMRRGVEHRDWVQRWSGNLTEITKSKRNLAEDDDGLLQPEKRQRVDGVNETNGTNSVDGTNSMNEINSMNETSSMNGMNGVGGSGVRA